MRACAVALALIIAAPALPALAASPEMLATGVTSLAPVLKDVTPAVVNIAVKTTVQVDNPLARDPFFRQFFNMPQGPQKREARASGSGVIVDAGNGYVLTNNHVVEHADQIEVTTKSNQRFKAKLVGRDPETDIAVLKIDGTGLKQLEMGNSDRLEVGDFVLAIGNPFGLGQTVTSGIVSALGRSGLGIEGYEDFIQTDASINPGNSGGALVDLKGKLIGINTAILAPSGGNVGVGFAVPISMARSIMEQLVKYGEVKRGRIGVALQDVTPELAQSMNLSASDGAVITQVEPGSPAARAGIKRGDVVTGVDGTPVHGRAQLRNHVGLTRAGGTVQLTYVRGGEQQKASVAVEPAKTPAKQAGPNGGPSGGDDEGDEGR